jgi:hypothetical protein
MLGYFNVEASDERRGEDRRKGISNRQGGSHPSGKDGRKSRGSGDDERYPDDI